MTNNPINNNTIRARIENIYQIDLPTSKKPNVNKLAFLFKKEIARTKANANVPIIQISNEKQNSEEEKNLCNKINQIRAKNKYKSRASNSNSRYESLPVQEDSVEISYKYKEEEEDKNQYSGACGKNKILPYYAHKKQDISSIETQETDKKEKSCNDYKCCEDINPLSQDYSANDMRKISEIITSGLGKKLEQYCSN